MKNKEERGEEMKNSYCHVCDKWFNSLGIARHKAKHRDDKAKHPSPPKCRWELGKYGEYNTICNVCYEYHEERKMDFKFCPYCRKEIKFNEK